MTAPAGADVQNKLTESCGLGRLKAAKECIANGADVNAYGKNTNNVMNTPLFAASFSGQLRIAQFLIEAGADANKPGIESLGNTPLIGASCQNMFNLVLLLIKNGADPNKPSRQGWSPLFFAAERGLVESMENLLNHGADINAVTPHTNQTALHNAAGGGHVKAVQLLLSRGADTTIICKFSTDSNVQGEGTPLDVARVRSRDAVVAVFENPSAEPYAPPVAMTHKERQELLCRACQNGRNEAMVNRLLDEGASLTESVTQSPLHWASVTGANENVRALVERGADVNAEYTSGQPALFNAIANQHADTVKILVELGANIFQLPSYHKYTSLHYAVERHALKVLTYLLTMMDVNMRYPGPSGYTCLHRAAACKKAETYTYVEDTVKFLLERGADPTAVCLPTKDFTRDTEVYGTPEEVAMMTGSVLNAKIIREWGKPPTPEPADLLKEALAENNTLRSQSFTMKREAEAARSEVVAQRAEVEALRATVAELKKASQEASTRLDQERERHRVEMAELQSSKDQLAQEASKLKEESAARSQYIEKLHETIKQLEQSK